MWLCSFFCRWASPGCMPLGAMCWAQLWQLASTPLSSLRVLFAAFVVVLIATSFRVCLFFSVLNCLELVNLWCETFVWMSTWTRRRSRNIHTEGFKGLNLQIYQILHFPFVEDWKLLFCRDSCAMRANTHWRLNKTRSPVPSASRLHRSPSIWRERNGWLRPKRERRTSVAKEFITL